MKVLLSAIACHPHLGSESKVGWDAARAISEIPQVEECHVMTHTVNRAAILQEQAAGRSGKVVFHYFGEPFKYHPNRMLARFQSWLIYRDWQTAAPSRASQLHSQHNFALTHHLTYASWRMPPKLWKLPIPFVFGPVGGGGTIRKTFRPVLGPSGRIFELFRDLTALASSAAGSLSSCCRNSAVVVAADSPTAHFLERHGARDAHRLCQVFFSEEQITRLQSAKRERRRGHLELEIFAGGNLQALKGTALTLQALARVRHLPFRYTYGVGGPEREAMMDLAKKLEISDRVTFHDGFTGAEYVHQLQQSNVYLLPSLRETAGITMMEAIIAGCYPIVLSETGAGDIAESVGGTTIHAGTPETVVSEIAEQLTWCYHHQDEMQSLAHSAGDKLCNLYSESAYQKRIFAIYLESIERHSETGKGARLRG